MGEGKERGGSKETGRCETSFREEGCENGVAAFPLHTLRAGEMNKIDDTEWYRCSYDSGEKGRFERNLKASEERQGGPARHE